MCGIAGSFGFGSQTTRIAEVMNACQVHRGPDGEGIHVDGEIGLAHRRLSIIDRAHGQQPMSTDDGRYTIAYNGEVYNYLPLREELTAAGRTLHTVSDTEVLLHAYAEWGSAAFDRFNGMFALAIHDAQEQRLILARDHFGIKPLYYWHDEETGRLLFASEIKALLHTGVFPAVPNDRSVYRYLKFRVQDDAEDTFFQGIRRLMPGQMLVADASGVTISAFTRLQEELRELAQQPPRPHTPEVVAEYRERLTEAVRMRLQAEVPVGTSLSGGLDSSAVAALIAQQLRDDPTDSGYASVGSRQNTFSAVFPNSRNDEEAYVDALLDKYEGQITAHKIHPSSESFLEDLRDFVRTQEEPIISTGPYAQYVVMREASEHVTVLLDGQGADEMMAGYNPYFYVYLNQLRRQKRFVELARELAASRDIVKKLAKVKFSGRASVPIEALLNSQFVQRFHTERTHVTNDNLKERLIEDTFRSSLPSLLRYEDKNTMRFSLEGRVPFVDKELMKFLFSLGEDAILHDGWNKRVLRDAMDGTLPEKISRRRNKIGFTTPEQEWFRTIKADLLEIFRSESFASRPYFDAPTVIALFEDYMKNPDNHGTLMFWRLLNVELWMREYIDSFSGQTQLADQSAAGEQPAASTVAQQVAAGSSLPQRDEPAKSDYVPNPGKELDLVSTLDQHTYRRFPLQTALVSRETDLLAQLRGEVEDFFADLPEDALPSGAPWTFSVSEKIVAITQGRSYFTWEVNPRPSAKLLSRFVTRTPAGIGLGDPTTMELAIREAGLPRVAGAAVVGAAGKVMGKRGLFYRLVGSNIGAIDGPTTYSAFPSNVSAKLPPKDPAKVAAQISAMVRGAKIPAEYVATFQGTVIMDANDIGRNVLGSDVPALDRAMEAAFADNPLGQGRQRTPLAIIARLD